MRLAGHPGGASSFSLGWDASSQQNGSATNYGGGAGAAGIGRGTVGVGSSNIVQNGGHSNSQYMQPPTSNSSFAIGRLGNQNFAPGGGGARNGHQQHVDTYRNMRNQERSTQFSNAASASISTGGYQPYQNPNISSADGLGTYNPQPSSYNTASSNAISSNAYASGSNQILEM